MAGGILFLAKSAVPYATNGPMPVKRDGTNFPVTGYAFDATTQEQVALEGRLVGYTGGTITVDFEGYADTATTNSFVMGCAIACATRGDAVNMETKSLATSQSSAGVSASGTSHGPVGGSISISSNLDSAAADDRFVLKFFRDVANGSDTMAGDAIITQVYVSWS